MAVKDDSVMSARERLTVRGARQLTDLELLTVLFQSKKEDTEAWETAERLLSHFSGKLSSISKTELSQLRKTAGIGIAKATLLQAALELGRRMSMEDHNDNTTITSDSDIINYFRPRLAGLRYEEFWAVYLSSANTVIDRSRVSQGGVSGTTVDHKIIVKRAVELLASGIILVHNHPSGKAEPSDADRLITNKIIRAASLFDIRVLDHIIISTGGSFSFKGNNLLEAGDDDL